MSLIVRCLYLFYLGIQNNGEAEDYAVYIISTDGCYPPVSISHEENGICSVLLSWNSPFGDEPLEYEYELRTSGLAGSGISGLITSGLTSDLFIEFNGVAIEQVYSFYVRSICEEDSPSDWSQAVVFEYSEDYIPVAVSGFNADVIAEDAAPAISTSHSLDGTNLSENNTNGGGNNYVFYVEGYPESIAGTGLPVNGLLNVNNKRYQLAAYDENNSLRLYDNEDAGTNLVGSLTLDEHIKASKIYVLGTSTEGNSVFSAKVIFEDDSYEIVTGVEMTDWAEPTQGSPVIQGLHRVQREYGNIDNTLGTDLKIFETVVEIASDNYGKKVKEVEITKTDGGFSFLHIFAISMANAPVYDEVESFTESVCHGAEVKIEGIVTNADGNWTIHLSTGDVISGNGDGSWEKTIVPDGDGEFTIEIDNITDEITCINNLTGLVTINMPVRTEYLSGDGESKTCFISGYNPIHFYNDASGNYIGSINPNGREGTVTMTSYLHDFGFIPGVDDGTMYDCDDFGNELKRTAFMKRSFTVVKEDELSQGDNITIYLPFVEGDYDDLVYRSTSTENSPGNTPENFDDIVTNIDDVAITKYEGSIINETPYDNCLDGASIVIEQENSSSLNDAFELVPEIEKDDNGNETPIYYASFSVDDFSEMYLHGVNDNSPLPVELTAFMASCEENNVKIGWTTASEKNTDYFALEKSRDGEYWQVLTTVPAVGNSIITHEYNVDDKNAIGVVYYRLRQVDINGVHKIYGPISSNCINAEGNDWIVYPNPTSGNFVVQITHLGEEETIELWLIDATGRKVVTQNRKIIKGQNQFLFDFDDLANGTYSLKVISTTEYRTLKVVVR